MLQGHRNQLERLGLSAVEAQIYLGLLQKGGSWRASAVAASFRIPRSTVYLALNALLDKGLVEAEAGYGGRFSAVPAERALPSLIAAEREEILQRQQEVAERERVAAELAQELTSVSSPAPTDSGAEVVQVLRDPRAVAERFERLQLETEEHIEAFVKAPFFNRPGNPAGKKVLRDGVRVRAVYERAVLEDPAIKPYFASWLTLGEGVRIFDGELPHKLQIFDSKIVLMPLIRPGELTKTVIIRHPQLAQSLTLVFEHFWERSELVQTFGEVSKTQEAKSRAAQRTGRNGRRGQFTKK